MSDCFAVYDRYSNYANSIDKIKTCFNNLETFYFGYDWSDAVAAYCRKVCYDIKDSVDKFELNGSFLAGMSEAFKYFQISFVLRELEVIGGEIERTLASGNELRAQPMYVL